MLLAAPGAAPSTGIYTLCGAPDHLGPTSGLEGQISYFPAEERNATRSETTPSQAEQPSRATQSEAKESEATQSETKQPSRERRPQKQENAKTRSTPTPANNNMSRTCQTHKPANPSEPHKRLQRNAWLTKGGRRCWRSHSQ